MESSYIALLIAAVLASVVSFVIGNLAGIDRAREPDPFDSFWYFPGSHRLLDMRDLETIRFNQDFSGMVIVKKGGAEYVTNERVDVDFAIGRLGFRSEDMES